MWQFFLAAFVVYLFGIGMFLLGYLPDKKRKIIKRDGIVTTATVVDIQKCFNDNRYKHKLTYITEDKKEVIVNWDEFHSLPYCKKHPIESKYDIIYLSESPTEFIVKKQFSMNIGFVFMKIVGICLMIFSLYILLTALKTIYIL